jgi:hypothetical protein
LMSGTAAAPGAHDADDARVCWLHRNDPGQVCVAKVDGVSELQVRRLCQDAASPTDDWTNILALQMLSLEGQTVETIQNKAPNVPRLGGSHAPELDRVRWVSAGTRRLRDPENNQDKPQARRPRVERRGNARPCDDDDDDSDEQPPRRQARAREPTPPPWLNVGDPANVPPPTDEELLEMLVQDSSQHQRLRTNDNQLPSVWGGVDCHSRPQAVEPREAPAVRGKCR